MRTAIVERRIDPCALLGEVANTRKTSQSANETGDVTFRAVSADAPVLGSHLKYLRGST